MRIRHARFLPTLALAACLAFVASPSVAAPGDPAPPAVTQAADSLVVENATFRLGPITYRVPRAELRGTSLSPAELSGLLDPAAPEPMAARLARLSAAEIAIPQITAEQGRQTTTYRDVLLSDVRQGRIASGRAGGASFEAAGETGTARGGFTHLGVTDLDLAASVALVTEKAGAAPAPLKKLYGSFSLEGISLTDPAGAVTRIARIAGRDLSARPTSEGWAGTLDLLGAAPPDLSDAEPEQRRRIFATLADMLGAFEFGSLEASGIEFQAPQRPDGPARIARIAFAGSAESGGEFRLEGLDIGSEDGRIRIGAIAVGGVALKPVIEGLAQIARRPDEMTPAEMRRLLPATGTLRVTDVAFEPERKAEAPGPISIGAIEIAAARPVEGLPSEMRIALSGLSLGIAELGGDGALGTLAALGYDRLNLSLGGAAGWNEATQEVSIRDLALRAPGLGSFTLSGTIGRVSRDVFSPDSTLALVALAGATAQSLDLTLQNDGLFERLIAREAKRQGRPPEDLRRDYGIAAAIGVPAALGNTGAAKTLGNAVARFVAKPGRLAIHAEARDGAGIGLADLAPAPDPAALLDRLDVTATTQ
jgi:hypothetical protein